MLSVFRWLSRWPLPLLHVCGALAGWLTYLVSPTYRRRFRANAAQAGVPAREARAAITEAGRMVMELPSLWLRPVDRPLGDTLRWDGTAHIEAALAAGRGVVFLTPHMGCFEVCAQALAERFGAITVLFRPARKEWVRRLVDSSRERPALHTAPANLAGVRKMIRALRRGEMVGLLPDQVPPEGMGVWAPFFGRPAYTMTLAARLAQQTGAAVVMVWGERLPRGAGYALHFSPFTEALPADPAAQVEAATAVNRAIERVIRECPRQYLWGYHRYKTPRQAAVAPEAGAAP